MILDCDPFAFDVGCLGVLFSKIFHARLPGCQKTLMYADINDE